jgi:hypothetical protein
MEVPEGLSMRADERSAITRIWPYTFSMSDSYREHSRSELTALMLNSDLGPATTNILTHMFWAFRELDGIEKGTELHHEKFWAMWRHERTLEESLGKDEECGAATMDFRALYVNNLLLRYGNYDQVNVLVLKAGYHATTKGDTVESDNKTRVGWDCVLDYINKEREARRVWGHSPLGNWLEAEYNDIRKNPPSRSQSPITYLLTRVAELCYLTFQQAVTEIAEHVKRRACFHTRERDIIRGWWVPVSQAVLQDTYALENQILPPNLECLKDDLLELIRVFRKKCFKDIFTVKDEPSCIPCLGYWTLSDEMVRQEEANEEAARLALSIRCLTEAECGEIVARAKAAKPPAHRQDWIDAQARLLEVSANTGWSAACDLSGEDAKALTLLKECVVKYQKYEKERRVMSHVDDDSD